MEDNDNIAKRTRSKLYIEEEPQDSLEFPDITDDLYGGDDIDDPEWIQFLNGLFDNQQSKIFEEDEANDPDYKAFEDSDGLTDNDVTNCSEITLAAKVDDNCLAKYAEYFTDDDICLIYQQMSQHIQLLTQTYLLTMNSITLGEIANQSSFLIKELNNFAGSKERSLFRPPNLQPSIKIIEEHPRQPRSELISSKNWRPAAVPMEVRPIFANNPQAFPYHHLLPQCGFFDCSIFKLNNKKKAHFSPAEDALIAIGLDQFQSEGRDCYKIIHKLLVPTKSELQIKMHVKNKKRNLCAIEDSNPIAYYLRHKKLIETKRPLLQPSFSYDDLSKLPDWLAKTISPQYVSDDKATRTKLKPIRTVPGRFVSPVKSRFKQAHSIIRKYRNLTKNPYTKLKSDNSIIQKSPLLDNPENNIPQNEPLCDVIIVQNPPSIAQVNPVTSPPQLNAFENGSPNEDEDNENDLAALMVASSTITSSKGRGRSHDSQSAGCKKEWKKTLLLKQKESASILLSKEWNNPDYDKEQKENLIVQNFLDKIRETMKSEDDYLEFLDNFSECDRLNISPAKAIQTKIMKMFNEEDAQKMMEDFVLLLNATEARECGKMFEYLHWARYMNFIRKLEMYSVVQPNCISRLYKALLHLKQNESKIDKKRLKSAVSKVIGGHSYLISEFNTCFLDEKPKEQLFAEGEDFDELNCLEDNEDAKFENVTLNLTPKELKYGTNECPCKVCHENPSVPITKHCVKCSIKFYGGKVYFQSSKKMRPAQIQYTSKKDDNRKNDLKNYIVPDKTQNVISALDQVTEIRITSQEKEWSLADDKILLESCKAKVANEENGNLDVEIFDEVAVKLKRKVDSVMKRFIKLMNLYKTETIDSNEDREMFMT